MHIKTEMNRPQVANGSSPRGLVGLHGNLVSD